MVAVTDINLERAQAAAPQGATVYETPQELIRAAEVQAVVICSWGPAHEEQLLDCIAVGKPVFCEKPLVTSAEAALRVMEAETAFGRRLVQVGFMRRFDADYRRLKAVIDGGTLGRCLDAASETGNGAVGTWPSQLPSHVGAPIDHILASPSWVATGSLVLQSTDGSGSDHRPLVVQYEPR